MKKIYVSPSDQTGNRYAVGNTNEAEQCRKIAAALVAALERCGFAAMTDYADGTDAMDKRIAQSNAWGADLHLPIHTNAFNGTVKGTRMFYGEKPGVGYDVCLAISKTLNPITPGESDNITAYPGLAEIRRVMAPAAYIEVGFHDSETEAAWIIGHTADIAEAICKGLCNYYGAAYVPADSSTASTPIAYNTVEELPEYAKPTIQKLVDRGYLRGTASGLELTQDMVRIFVIHDRAGLYD